MLETGYKNIVGLKSWNTLVNYIAFGGGALKFQHLTIVNEEDRHTNSF